MSNILGMSDEDFLNQGSTLMDDDIAEGTQEEAEPETSGEQEQEEEVDETTLDSSGSEEEPQEENEEEASEADNEPEASLNPELDESPEEGENDSESASQEVSEGNELQRILEPFRANGKDVQVKNADEAIQLMQLGANYTKKMQELSPNIKVLKTLEKNELLDPEKLNYLIDLSKNDPKAIAKLVKESNFEMPDGFDAEYDDVEYTPTNHQVSDKVVELEQVLSAMESTPTYDKCIDLVGNQWDAKSKQLLTQEPQLINSLNEQMQAGIFDKINNEVERVKMFGGLSGLSDFEAYKTVGAQLMQRGELVPPKPKPIAKTQVKPLDKALSQKRKAATTSKSTSKTTAKEELNPLAMSDEDFLKINNIQL